MGYNKNYRVIKGKRFHVNFLASQSRLHTVRNCTILKKVDTNTAEWWSWEDKYTKHKVFLNKEEQKKLYSKTIAKPMTREEYWEGLVQHKLDRWIRKHPRPIKDDKINPDLFENQLIPEWEAEKTAVEERFRDFVISKYDKLHIVGNRVNRKEGKMTEQTVAKIKDVDGKGHDVNYPNLKKSDKLYTDATEAAQNAMNKDPSIVDCALKNHRKDQKRPLIHAKRGKAKPSNLQQRRQMKKAA